MAVLNLTAELERLIADVVRRLDEFAHIDPTRLLVCITGTRGGGVQGMYAKIHPLRFAGGARSRVLRRGRRTVTATFPAVTHQGKEILYLIYFLTPRFFDLSLREKLVTIFHELYHISPACDGDIRRFPGRTYAHGSSTRRYNQRMGELVDAYLARLADPGPLHFLDGTLAELRSRHPALVGRKLTAPRLTLTPGGGP
jgi:hypothetical protein